MHDPAHPRLFNLIREIEALRLERQEQYRVNRHPQFKTFSQQELNDIAFPSYKNYLLGRTQRLPIREAILSIADYLECSTNETNHLLIAGGYLPVIADPEGAVLDGLIAEGRATLNNLPFPAVLSTRDWRVHGMNTLYTALWNVPTYEQTPPDKQHNLHLLFHTDFSGRRPAQSRMQTLSGALTAFHTHNRQHTHDDWFNKFVEVGSQFSDFNKLWQQVKTSRTEFQNIGEIYINRTELIYRFRFLHISIGQHLYPLITAFIALDTDSHRHLAAFTPAP